MCHPVGGDGAGTACRAEDCVMAHETLDDCVGASIGPGDAIRLQRRWGLDAKRSLTRWSVWMRQGYVDEVPYA